MKTLAAFLAGLVFCSACEAKTGASSGEELGGTSRCAELIFGGAWSTEIRYKLADRQFEVEEYAPVPVSDGGTQFTLTAKRRYLLDPAVADESWRQLLAIGVFEWKRKYGPTELGVTYFDGVQWSLDCRVGKKGVVSCGDNIYPSSYSALLSLFKHLDRQANQSPEPTRSSVTPR